MISDIEICQIIKHILAIVPNQHLSRGDTWKRHYMASSIKSTGSCHEKPNYLAFIDMSVAIQRLLVVIVLSNLVDEQNSNGK